MDDLGGNIAGETTEMAPETAVNPTSELRKRRSTRIVQAVPLQVTGVDALGRPFMERTSSLILNCHGCRYQSKHYVLKNMWVKLEVPNPQEGETAAHGARPRRVDSAAPHCPPAFPGRSRTRSSRQCLGHRVSSRRLVRAIRQLPPQQSRLPLPIGSALHTAHIELSAAAARAASDAACGSFRNRIPRFAHRFRRNAPPQVPPRP